MQGLCRYFVLSGLLGSQIERGQELHLSVPIIFFWIYSSSPEALLTLGFLWGYKADCTQ